MYLRYIVKDIHIQNIANLSYFFLLVLIIATELHFFQKVATKQPTFVFIQPRLKHSFDNRMEALNITKLAGRSTKPIEYSSQKTSHVLDLFVASAKPNIGSLNVPTNSLKVIPFFLFVGIPPLIQLSFPQNVVLQELLQLNCRIYPFICSHKFDYDFCALLSFGILEHSFMQSDEVGERQIDEDILQLNIGKGGDDTFFGCFQMIGQTGMSFFI